MAKREIDKADIERLDTQVKILRAKLIECQKAFDTATSQLKEAEAPYVRGTILERIRRRPLRDKQNIVRARYEGVRAGRFGWEYYGIRIRKDGSDGEEVRMSFHPSYGDQWQEVTNAEA